MNVFCVDSGHRVHEVNVHSSILAQYFHSERETSDFNDVMTRRLCRTINVLKQIVHSYQEKICFPDVLSGLKTLLASDERNE